MKKYFYLISFFYVFSSLSAMTESEESKKPKVIEALVSTSETNFSLEAINARLAKIAVNGKCFLLKFAPPVDMEHSTIKTINIFHGDAKIGDIIYGVPKPDSTYDITFWRQLYKFTNHGLGMILALVALDDAFKISKCPNVFVTSTTKESVMSLKKFGFTTDPLESASPEGIVTFRSDNLQKFLKTKAPELLEEAFTKLTKAGTKTVLA